MQRRLTSLILCFFVTFSFSGHGAGRYILRGHIPKGVASLEPVGWLPGTNHLELAIGLPLHKSESLKNLLRQIYDPNSPEYHHYVSPSRFREAFGATEAEYQAVIDFARSKGLVVTATHPNRMLVDVAGSVSDVESAFQVNLRVYVQPENSRTFFSAGCRALSRPTVEDSAHQRS
jgi:subtilase family serine protease